MSGEVVLTEEMLRSAWARMLNAPRRPEFGPIHPRMYALACDLLGVPNGSPLTVGDIYRAMELELVGPGSDGRRVMTKWVDLIGIDPDYPPLDQTFTAAELAAIKADVWDECVRALAWCLIERRTHPDVGLPYVAEHNPYRTTPTPPTPETAT